jgi:hypothetical protein
MNYLYESFISKLQYGDILLFYNKKNIVSKLLQIFLKNSHCAVYAGNENIIHQTWPICIESKLKTYLRFKAVTVLRWRDIIEAEQIDIVSYAYQDVRNKVKYDIKAYGGFLPFAIINKLGLKIKADNPYDDPRKWVCSTAVGKWYAKARLELTKWGIERLTPDDILIDKKLYPIFYRVEVK